VDQPGSRPRPAARSSSWEPNGVAGVEERAGECGNCRTMQVDCFSSARRGRPIAWRSSNRMTCASGIAASSPCLLVARNGQGFCDEGHVQGELWRVTRACVCLAVLFGPQVRQGTLARYRLAGQGRMHSVRVEGVRALAAWALSGGRGGPEPGKDRPRIASEKG